MKQQGDKVQFESRYYEVDAIAQVLDQWLKEHPEANSANRQAAKDLYSILEKMYIGW